MKNRVRELREDKKITQIYLAMNVGCAQNTISKIELGIGDPKTSLLIELSRYFNVSIEYLLGLPEYRNNVPIDIFDRKNENIYSGFWRVYQQLNDVNKETVKIITQRLMDVQKGDECKR